jgi:hypothetical protein
MGVTVGAAINVINHTFSYFASSGGYVVSIVRTWGGF